MPDNGTLTQRMTEKILAGFKKHNPGLNITVRVINRRTLWTKMFTLKHELGRADTAAHGYMLYLVLFSCVYRFFDQRFNDRLLKRSANIGHAYVFMIPQIIAYGRFYAAE